MGCGASTGVFPHRESGGGLMGRLGLAGGQPQEDDGVCAEDVWVWVIPFLPTYEVLRLQVLASSWRDRLLDPSAVKTLDSTTAARLSALPPEALSACLGGHEHSNKNVQKSVEPSFTTSYEGVGVEEEKGISSGGGMGEEEGSIVSGVTRTPTPTASLSTYTFETLSLLAVPPSNLHVDLNAPKGKFRDEAKARRAYHLLLAFLLRQANNLRNLSVEQFEAPSLQPASSSSCIGGASGVMASQRSQLRLPRVGVPSLRLPGSLADLQRGSSLLRLPREGGEPGCFGGYRDDLGGRPGRSLSPLCRSPTKFSTVGVPRRHKGGGPVRRELSVPSSSSSVSLASRKAPYILWSQGRVGGDGVTRNMSGVTSPSMLQRSSSPTVADCESPPPSLIPSSCHSKKKKMLAALKKRKAAEKKGGQSLPMPSCTVEEERGGGMPTEEVEEAGVNAQPESRLGGARRIRSLRSRISRLKQGGWLKEASSVSSSSSPSSKCLEKGKKGEGEGLPSFDSISLLGRKGRDLLPNLTQLKFPGHLSQSVHFLSLFFCPRLERLSVGWVMGSQLDGLLGVGSRSSLKELRILGGVGMRSSSDGDDAAARVRLRLQGLSSLESLELPLSSLCGEELLVGEGLRKLKLLRVGLWESKDRARFPRFIARLARAVAEDGERSSTGSSDHCASTSSEGEEDKAQERQRGGRGRQLGKNQKGETEKRRRSFPFSSVHSTSSLRKKTVSEAPQEKEEKDKQTPQAPSQILVPRVLEVKVEVADVTASWAETASSQLEETARGQHEDSGFSLVLSVERLRHQPRSAVYSSTAFG
uniref:F-box domain-containing protein n=1 Tax=Chromera velia CCMP2878 TaxID=1169474 RepID=A0A0G4HU98_9ALVE|eukprot:Cvel_1374.t1-p1 / transcript=Cvel_1374.t1 / gene=Cvel_1374 / organism=Chromera_velia_CCMP2878 / gene_product=hypothetical protein / transcript_product=hypothetical protein / location=Cvel_scaffold47:124918-129273(+) / protein_length=812 / sequence_SO=supercontig / SO=protein_coding / is_pseudo=false